MENICSVCDPITLSKMDGTIDPEEVKELVFKGLTHQQISETLQARFPQISRGLSERSVRRFCSQHSIHKPTGVELDSIVEDAVSEVG